jgi:putative peptidoglycan lipid II flippase
VAQAAVLIAVVTFLSKFVGFAREVVIARQFGATGQTDAFLVGMMVPSLVLGLFAGGLGTLIVPWYLGYKKEDPERARLLVDQVTLVWSIVFALVCVGVWAYAPQLVHIFARGFEGARYDLAVQVTRLLVPMGFMGIMTGLFTGLLQAESSFLVALMWTFLGNVVLVASLLAFSSRMGIHAWTLGQTLLAVVSFVPLVILLAGKRYGFLERFDVRHMDWPGTSSSAGTWGLPASPSPPVSRCRWARSSTPSSCAAPSIRRTASPRRTRSGPRCSGLS